MGEFILCRNCGSRVDLPATFCGECGARIEQAHAPMQPEVNAAPVQPVVVPVSAVASQPMQSQAMVQQPMQSQAMVQQPMQSQAMMQPKPKKKGKGCLIVFIIVFVVLLVIGAIAFFLIGFIMQKAKQTKITLVDRYETLVPDGGDIDLGSLITGGVIAFDGEDTSGESSSENDESALNTDDLNKALQGILGDTSGLAEILTGDIENADDNQSSDESTNVENAEQNSENGLDAENPFPALSGAGDFAGLLSGLTGMLQTEWEDNDYTRQIEKPEFGTLQYVMTLSDYNSYIASYTVTEADKDAILDYVDTLENELGFHVSPVKTEDEGKINGFFKASDENGNTVSTEYTPQTFLVIIQLKQK